MSNQKVSTAKSMFLLDDKSFNTPEIRQIADRAYQFCTQWFGPPIDPKRPYQLRRGKQSGCILPLLGTPYIIVLHEDIKVAEQFYFELAHEMYHRVTMHRKGLRTLIWADEALAVLTSLHFLRQCGYNAYADHIVTVMQMRGDNIPISSVLQSRRRGILGDLVALARNKFYSPDFAAGIGCLAFRLEECAGWEAMCRMVEAKDLNQWLAILPTMEKEKTVKLLNLPAIKKCGNGLM